MENNKLQEIGDKLNVSNQEIKEIRKRNRRSLGNRILYIVISALIAAITFILGFFAGQGTCPSTGGYPYTSALFAPAVITNQKRGSKIAVLLIAAAGFLLAFKMSPVFGQAIKYGVYEKG